MLTGKSVLRLTMIAPAIFLASCVNQSATTSYEVAIRQSNLERTGRTFYKDPNELFENAVAEAKTPKTIVRYNRAYADYLEYKGKNKLSLAAYERAALAGDTTSAFRVATAHYKGTYRPNDIPKFAREAYIPGSQAKPDNVTVRLLMARLVQTGVLRSSEFGGSNKWLNEAANLGSSAAIRTQAESAEARGDIAAAARFYAKFDKGTKSERALRQARDYYLGRGRKANYKNGKAWLKYAARLNKSEAGKLASRVYRSTNGKIHTTFLSELALASGASLGGSQLGVRSTLEAYYKASSASEKAAVLRPLRTAAKTGNANAAFSLSSVLTEVKGDKGEIVSLLISAHKGKNADALTKLTEFAARSDSGSETGLQALNYVTATALGGNVKSMTALANIYNIGGIVPSDDVQSRQWLKKAADAGDTESQYKLGITLGLEAATDEEKKAALAYIKKAANSGNPTAKSYLANAI